MLQNQYKKVMFIMLFPENIMALVASDRQFDSVSSLVVYFLQPAQVEMYENPQPEAQAFQ